MDPISASTQKTHMSQTYPSFVNEPVYVRTNGTVQPYIPPNIRTSRDVYAASLHIIFKHVADFHITVVDILADKYGFSADEAMETIHTDPRFQHMQTDPIINTMSCFSEDDYKPKQAYTDVSECTTALLEQCNNPQVSQSTSVQPPKKRTIVRKKKQEAPSPETIEAAVEETIVQQTIIPENTIPEITVHAQADAKAQALEKAKAKAKARQKKEQQPAKADP